MKNTKRLLINTLTLAATSFLMRTVGVAFNVYLTGRLGAAGIGLFSLVTDVYAMALTFSFAGLPLASTRLHGRRFRKKCRSGRMDNAAVRALRADGRVHDARRRMVRRGADSKIVARRHTHGVVASHTRAEPPCGIGRLRVQRIFHGAAHSAQICGGADIRAGDKNSGLCSDASILGGKGRRICLRRGGARHNDIADKLAAMRLFALQINEAPKAERKNARRASGSAAHCAPGRRRIVRALGAADDRTPADSRGLSQIRTERGGAMTLYGVIHGMALPVILYPAAIMTALASMLVPEFAECAARGNRNRIDSMAARAIKITVLFSMGTAGIMFIFSEGAVAVHLRGRQCAEYLRVLAPLLPIMYTDTTVDGILKGLDQQVYSMRYNIIDSAMCVVLVLILIPKYSVKGYVAILFISEIVNFSLSIHRLSKVCTLEINIMDSIIKPAVCVTASFLAGLLLSSAQGSGKAALTIIITINAAVYILLLMLTGSISVQDIIWFKNIFSRGSKSEKRGLCAARINDRQRSMSH